MRRRHTTELYIEGRTRSHLPVSCSTFAALFLPRALPPADTLVTEDVALQITNITLEVDEASTSKKRSVLKMQHLEAEPALLRAASGYDLASDSEYDDDSEIDSDEFDDEEDEDDEEMEADTSKVSKASTSSKANGKVNGKPAEEEDDEDDEDDEEDEDEEDFDFDREEHEVQICSFIPGQVGWACAGVHTSRQRTISLTRI